MNLKRQVGFFVGMSFTWMLLRTTTTRILIARSAPLVPWALDCYYLFIIGFLVFALAGTFAWKRITPLLENRFLILGLAGLTSLGNCAVTCLLQVDSLHPIVLVTTTIIFAFTVPLLASTWFVATLRFLRESKATGFLSVCGSFVASYVFGLVQYLPNPAPLILPIVAPLASACFLVYGLSWRSEGVCQDGLKSSQEPDPSLGHLPVGSLLALISALVLGYILVGFLQPISIGEPALEFGLIRTFVTATLTFLIAYALWKIPRKKTAFRLVWIIALVPLCLGSMLIVITDNSAVSLIGIAIMNSARGCFTLFLFLYLAVVCLERSIHAIRAYSCFYLFAKALCDLLSIYAIPTVISSLGASYESLIQSAALAIDLAAFLFFVVFSGRMAFVSSFEEPQGKEKNELLADYAITDREWDVLLLISEGNSYKATAQQLHISEGTVQSHIKRIYTKLNVHSRQELIDFLRR